MDWKILTRPGSRDVNEDSVQWIEHGRNKCFIVADGLGGHGKGDIASALAVQTFDDVFRDETKCLKDLLITAFQNTQSRLIEEQQKAACPFQMKTTVCALAIQNSRLMWGHIGDSRVYAFSRGKVRARTLDHSVPQMLALSKEIKEREIRNHPDRNKLLRVLGISGDAPRYELSEEQELRRFQAFLLCSDGFWELILEKEMETLLKKSHSAEEWLYMMQQIVETQGRGTDMDNYSAVAVRV